MTAGGTLLGVWAHPDDAVGSSQVYLRERIVTVT